MATNQVTIRFSATGAELVQRALQGIGTEGDKMRRQLENAMKGPSTSLKALNTVSREAGDAMTNLANRAGTLGRTLASIGPAGLAAGAAIGVLGFALKRSIDAFAESERAQLRFGGVLKATGGIAGKTKEEIIALSETLERSTFFSSEQILQASTVLGTFKNISGETFERAIKLSTDLAEVFQTDLSTAAKQLAKALEDPVDGLGALKKAGIDFGEEQLAVIEVLVKTGNTAAAAGIILDELSGKLGGAATEAASGAAGQIDNLSDAFGDLLKSIGGLANSIGIFSFLRTLADTVDALTEAVQRSKRVIDGGFSASETRNEFYLAERNRSLQDVERFTLRGYRDPKRNAAALAKAEGEVAYYNKQLFALDDKAAAGGQRAFAEATTSAAKAVVLSTKALEQDQKVREKATKVRKAERDQLEQYMRSLEDEATLIGLSDRERKIQESLIRAENLARADGVKLTAQQSSRIRELVGAQQDEVASKKAMEEAARDLARAQEEAMKPFQHAFENVQDSLADMLAEGKFSFESLADIAKRLAAEVAAAWVIRPLIAPVASSLGLGGVGGSGGNLLSSASNFIPNDLLGDIGSALGLGGAGGAAAGVGAAIGTANAAAAATGAAAAATAGAATLASVASFALPALAIAAPLLGGLFGSKPSNKLQGGIVDLETGMVTDRNALSQSGKKFSQENADAVTKLAASATALAKLISPDIQDTLAVKVGSRSGFSYDFNNSQTGQRDFGDVGAFMKALTEDLIARAPDVAEALRTSISRIDFSNIDQALADVGFAAVFDSFGEAQPKVSQLAKAMREMSATAERLGLSVDKVSAGFKSQFDKSIGDAILGIINPGGAATAAEISRYQQDRADAIAVNGDLQQVELLHKLKLLEIEKQYGREQEDALALMRDQQQAAAGLANQFKGFSDSLARTITGLRVGQYSPLNPVAQFELAMGNFRDTLTAARLGDTAAFGQLEGQAQTALALNQRVNASTAEAAAFFYEIEKGLSEAKGVADRQVSLQQSISDGMQRQIATTEAGFSALTEEVRKLTTPYMPSATGLAEGYNGGAFSAANPNEIVIRNRDAITAAGLMTSTEALLARFTPGVTPGAGRRSAFFDANPFYAGQFIAQAKALGIPGFALGGITPVNQPFLVGERGPEIMQFSRSGQVTPIVSNDSGMKAELRGLRGDIQTLVRLTADVGRVNAHRLGAAVVRLDAIEGNARLRGGA